jgi:type IX secretion system PorP/SprF family membrane protein
MNRALLILSLIMITGRVAGQIDPLYAQYLNNPLAINPAYAGFNDELNASLIYRKQWAGFDGSPVTVNASVHSSVSGNKMGLGLMIVQDKIGVSKNTEVQATYSYKLKLNEKQLSFGLQAGFLSYANDYSDLNPQDPGAPEFSSNQVYTKPSFGAGLILSSDTYFVGLSVPRMLKNTADFGTGETQLYQQHFYLTGSYVFFLSERVRLKPSVLLKAVSGAPVSGDYNFACVIDDKYTAGLYTRNLESYGVLAQMRLSDRYRFGYAFELPTNQSVGTRYTTHELMIGVNLSVLGFHHQSTTSF